MEFNNDLLNKYNIPVPRYTSYPTVPYWNDSIDIPTWENLFSKRFKESNQQEGISLYIHLPFCEKLCTFCGCNKKITTNHSVENEYIEFLIKEWKIYLQLMGSKPIISELHIGGGTPTFFTPKNLEKLLTTIYQDSIVSDNHEYSFEGHPNNTSYEHLKMFYDLGFNRVSFGMQDSNADVQKIINRVQPQKNVIQVIDWARSIGYDSVNIDLIYGLPLQTLETMHQTILDALAIKPDRIAFYSYAHIPWTSKAQRLFDENDLPSTAVKMQLYQLGKKMFTEQGYVDIGMDHFGLKTDLLVTARTSGDLHRNFMGYTVQKTNMLLGLGVSSISDIHFGFAQNIKTIHEYYDAISKEKLAIFKGYFLNEEDMAMRQYILDIACLGKTTLNQKDKAILEKYSYPILENLETDGLITWDEKQVIVTTLGKNFIRNICKAFDIKLISAENQKQSFSKGV